MVLEGVELRLPPAILGLAALVVAPLIAVAAWHLFGAVRGAAGGESAVWIATSLVPLLAFSWFGRQVWRRTWVPYRVRVDRDAGELELVERSLLAKRDRSETLPLDRMASLTVGTVARNARVSLSLMDVSERPNVRLTFVFDEAGRKPRTRIMTGSVLGLDRREEVADLAYRLGAAAGLGWQRVVRSDVRDIEIEMSAAPLAGGESLPLPDRRADYAVDQVGSAARAAAAQERIPPFEPASFPSAHAVARWQPGREVRLHRAFRLGGMGCLPFVLAGLALGPTAFVFLTPRLPGISPGERLGVSLVVGVFGLVIALVALSGLYSALPRRVHIDWDRSAVEIRDGLARRRIALGDIKGLEARCVRTHHRGGRNSRAHNTYRCEVRGELATVTAGEDSVLIVATREFDEDPDTPYRRTLPLVAELAEALGVPRRVTDYT